MWRSLSEGLRRFEQAATRPGAPWLAGGVALGVYLVIALGVLGTSAVWSPDTGAKLWQMQSLRFEDGALRWDLRYRGRELDPELRFADEPYAHAVILTVVGDELHLRRLPVFPALLWPFDQLFGNSGRVLLPALAGAALGVMALLLVPTADRRPWMWGLVAFASPVTIYSVLVWEHNLASAVALAGVVWALHCPRASTRAWLGVGALLGGALYLRVETALVTGPFLVALAALDAERRRGAVVAFAGLLAGAVLYPITQNAMFGDPVPQNMTHIVLPFSYLSDAGLNAVRAFLVGPFTHGSINTGAWGMLWAWAALAAFILAAFSLRSGWLLLLALTAALAVMFLLTDVPYQAAHGLLFTTPWVAVALCRIPDLLRASPRARLLAAAALLATLAYAVAILVLRGATPDGGREWGSRFAMTLFPLLAVVAAWPSVRPRETHRGTELAAALASVVPALLFVLGIGFQIRGLITIERVLDDGARFHRQLAALEDEAIVTDVWWLALDAVPAELELPIYTVEGLEEPGVWLAAARRHGVG
ncbi:MAG: hypothetical protein AAF560_20855, partial [Acidobacteriota bacterium]